MTNTMSQDFCGEPFPFIRGEQSHVYEPTSGVDDHGDDIRLEQPTSISPQAPPSVDPNPARLRRDHMWSRDSDNFSIVPGRLYQMGRLDRAHSKVNGVRDPDSILWTQRHVNNDVGEHIVMLTSFGDSKMKYSGDANQHLTIEQKYYGRTWKYHMQYLTIEHSSRSSVPHDMPILTFKNGDAFLQHQTYVHLDHFFEIEIDHLSRQRDKYVREFDDRSFCVLMHRLDRFVHKSWGAQQTRRGDGSFVASPLDLDEDGPEFSPWITECSKYGRVVEEERFARHGGRFWTGIEPEHRYYNPNKPNAWRPKPRPNSGPSSKTPRGSSHGSRPHAGPSSSRGFNDPRPRMPVGRFQKPFN
ncbi:hypothetical protein LTR95_016744 [Oleoguttula sp. CCFEE 5521]